MPHAAGSPPPPDAPSQGEVSPEAALVIRRRTGGTVGAVLLALTALALLLLWGATVSGRMVRGPPAPLALVVTFLPYLYALLVAWAFALWCALPDRWGTPVVLAATVLTAGGLWGPSWPARGEHAAGVQVTVMAWNVQRLWGVPGVQGEAIDCVVEAIEEVDPEFLFLLEVSKQDVERLGGRLGLQCAHADYFNVGHERFGGLASCVRGDAWRLRRGRPQRFLDAQSWHYVLAEAERDDHVVNLLAVHLHPHGIETLDVPGRLRQLGRGQVGPIWELARTGQDVVRAQGGQSQGLIEHLGTFRDPTVVAGDFNSTPDSALHVALRRHLVDAWQRGGRGFGGTVRFLDVLPLRIDYVYVSEAFAVVDARVPRPACSDHEPVVTRVVLREGPALDKR